MLGDKLVITDYHRQGAMQVWERLSPRFDAGHGPLAVSVAGESGSGKSEIGYCLAELAEKKGLTAIVLGQDDYFILPPKSNHRKREADIAWVGPGEVRLDLLDAHIAHLKQRPDQALEKPLVDYDADAIDSEIVGPGPFDLIVAEGTYTTLLQQTDLRAFIDRNYHQTRKNRLRRAREKALDFIEQVLEIEHQEISRHKARADVIIAAPPEERS
jgi:uridine kinase